MDETELTRLVVSLIRSGGGMTEPELRHELTVLRRTGCLQLPQVTESWLVGILTSLQTAGRVQRTDSVWHAMKTETREQVRLF